jgi:hypothetical protein
VGRDLVVVVHLHGDPAGHRGELAVVGEHLRDGPPP